MPGPGAHFFYAMTSGLALSSLSKQRFGAHHILFYTLQAFVGPDIGVFGEWIFKDVLHHYPQRLQKFFMNGIHDPWGYMWCSFGLALVYMYLSRLLLKWRWLRLYSQAPLTYIQSFLLGATGGISHFFMDSLFERKSRKLEAVLATGDANKQVYPFPVAIVAIILTSLFAVFFCIYRSGPARSPPPASHQSPPRLRSLFAPLRTLLISGWMAPPCVPRSKFDSVCGCLRSAFPELWCLKSYVRSSIRLPSVCMGLFLCFVASVYVKFLEVYKTSTQYSGIGEEADVGVVIFMATYFLAPHLMCILAMHQEE
uniref:uncharacterized protein LOC101301979 n=1 Tax=Fragaria vesca subsp. vesca TaxID=101020 RepID=UPI0005CA0BC0|nr:PREDICTED: uncharacterized protein LOC101301979 [Fragaria vesca subsp. vesca]